MNKKNKLQTMILAAGIALLFTLAGCGSPIEYEGADAPDFAILEQKTANDTSWTSNPYTANYSGGILSISNLGIIAPDVASYAEGIVVREVTNAATYDKVYVQGTSVPVTFLYFNVTGYPPSTGTAYFSANLVDSKSYEVYINAAKLTRQGGVKLNGDGDSTPGEEADGQYLYVYDYNLATGQRRWTNRTLGINYTDPTHILDNGSMDILGYLESSMFSESTQASYKALIGPKLKLYSVSTNGSKTELGAPSLTWVSSDTKFKITPASPIPHSTDLAYLELVVTDCDQINSPVMYGFKEIKYTYKDTEKTRTFKIQHGGYADSSVSFNYIYGTSVHENSTTTSIVLTLNDAVSYTKLTPADVIVLRLPKAQHPTSITEQLRQFQVVTPEIQTANGVSTGQVTKQVITIPKPDAASSYYYFVAIKYNTPIKSSATAIEGYFGNIEPTPSVSIPVPTYSWNEYDGSGQWYQNSGPIESVDIPIPSEYWLWPSKLLSSPSS